jgi:hypothetical protein
MLIGSSMKYNFRSMLFKYGSRSAPVRNVCQVRKNTGTPAHRKDLTLNFKERTFCLIDQNNGVRIITDDLSYQFTPD